MFRNNNSNNNNNSAASASLERQGSSISSGSVAMTSSMSEDDSLDASALMMAVPEDEENGEFAQALSHWETKLADLSYNTTTDTATVPSRGDVELINGGGATIAAIPASTGSVGATSVKSSFGLEVPHASVPHFNYSHKDKGNNHLVDEEENDIDDEETDMDIRKPKKKRMTRNKKKRNTLRFWLCQRRAVVPILVVLCVLALIVGVLLGTPRNQKRTSNTAAAVTSTSSAVLYDETNNGNNNSGTNDDDDNDNGTGLNLGFVATNGTDDNSTTVSPSNLATVVPSTRASLAPSVASSLVPTTISTTLPSLSPTDTPLASWSITAQLSMTKVGDNNDNNNDSTSSSSSSFGYSVSMSATGNFLAVGVPGYGRSGVVQLFAKQPENASQWTALPHLQLTDPKFAEFGSSVRLSADGTSLAVRTLHQGLFLFGGGVYVMVFCYDFVEQQWYVDPALTLYLSSTADTNTDVDQSAMAFSGQGKTIALASTTFELEQDTSSSTSDGSGDVNDSSGSSENEIEVEDLSQIVLFHNYKYYHINLFSTIHHSDHFLSLSYDGQRLAYSDKERVYVKEFYHKNVLTQYWTQVGQPLEANDDDFGSSVVLSPCGSYLAVSSRRRTRVYVAPPHGVQDWVGTSTSHELAWQQLGQTVDNLDDGRFASVALWSHNLTFTGDASGSNTAPRTETLLTLALSDAGSVRILQYNTRGSTEWTPKGSHEHLKQEPFSPQNGNGAALVEEYHYGEGFGNSISLSEDGLTVAVGAPILANDDEGHAAGDGKVLIYELDY